MRKELTLLLLGAATLVGPPSYAATPQSQAAMDRGVSLFSFGKWSDANLEFLKARDGLLSTDLIDQERVDFYLAVCALKLGNAEPQVPLIEFMTKYKNSVYTNDARFELGVYYCSLSQMQVAKSYFESVDYSYLSDLQRERFDIRMGYINFLDSNFEKAYENFSRIPLNSKYTDHATYYMAYIDYQKGEYADAKQSFSYLGNSDAYKNLVPYFLIQIEFKEENYQYVINNADALIAQASPAQRAELDRIVAESWFRMGDYSKVVQYINDYKANSGEMDRDVNYLMGFSLYRMTRYDEAVEYLRRASGADDSLTQNASYHLADCYLRLGDKRSAMQAFALAANDDYDARIAQDALFNYGKLQYELGEGRFNETINVLTRYITKYPDSDRTLEARNLLIAAYYNSHNYDAAYEAIKSFPSPDASVRAALQKIAYFRGLEAFTQGDYTKAQSALAESRTVGVAPKYNALSLFWLGEISQINGDYEAAANNYMAYIARAPRGEWEYMMAHYNLAYCRFEQKRMKDAQRAFTTFIDDYTTKDQYRADAINRLADTYYSERQFNKAEELYEESIMLGGQTADYAQYQRAITLGILGNTDGKMWVLRQIIEGKKGDYIADASYELGRSYIAEQNYKQGATTLEEFIANFPTAPQYSAALSDLGLAYLNLGDNAKSIQYYDMVVKAAPQSAEARGAMQGIKNIYLSDGDADGYFAYAEKVGAESDLTDTARDSLSFAAAQKLYLTGNNSAAAKSLRSYVRTYENGAYMVDALYYLSDCYLKLNESDNAIQSLTELSELGGGKYAAVVLEKLAQLTWDAGQFEKSATTYRKLYDVSQSQAVQDKAIRSYVDATLKLNNDEKTLAMANDITELDVVAEEPMRKAVFAKAEILERKGENADAMYIYKYLADQEVQSYQGAASAYKVIESTFNSGDMKATEDKIFEFSDQNPTNSYFLAKSFLILGDVYASKGDAFQARATYQSIVDGYSPDNDGVIELAKEKINNLKDQNNNE